MNSWKTPLTAEKYTYRLSQKQGNMQASAAFNLTDVIQEYANRERKS
jgi:hypothetical protein